MVLIKNFLPWLSFVSLRFLHRKEKKKKSFWDSNIPPTEKVLSAFQIETAFFPSLSALQSE